jgi:hypothetical protein
MIDDVYHACTQEAMFAAACGDMLWEGRARAKLGAATRFLQQPAGSDQEMRAEAECDRAIRLATAAGDEVKKFVYDA